MPESVDCDGVGVLRMLDATRARGLDKTTRFYQASTTIRQSQGDASIGMHSILSPLSVRCGKAGYLLYSDREAYGMPLTDGISLQS
mmetsp:Transcript_7698/g.17424  ORF Transcript_7698/g.17424 Transcript_7698/m.17424 type:complete len:86 (+) Transcript_7698:292-549(+)